MDPYKVLGISANQVKHESDLDKVRHRAKSLFKRHSTAGSKFEAKKVMEAFELLKQRLKHRPGEGAYKILGRSRKERELDKHFNHQTKEIKNNKGLKKALKNARHGSSKERIHLPGDKERIPRPRRRRDRRRRRREKRKHTDVNILQGLNRLAVFLPQESKFPKVIKLLYRWMKDYMNIENREYVFRVLHDVSNCSFLLEEAEVRQDVIQTFEYVLGYFTEWFKKGGDATSLFAKNWQIATVLACRCHTDDAFVLASTIAKLGETMVLLERHKDIIGVLPQKRQRVQAKKEEKDEKEEKSEDDSDRGVKRSKSEVKSEDSDCVGDDDVKSEASFGEVVAGKAATPSNGCRMALPVDTKREAEVKTEVKVEAKPDASGEERKISKGGRPLMGTPLIGMGPRCGAGAAQPASDSGSAAAAALGPALMPSPLASPGPIEGSPSSDVDDNLEVLSSASDCVDVGSDDDIMNVGSEGSDDGEAEEIDVGSSDLSGDDGQVSSEGEVEEVEGSIFPTPPPGQSLDSLRRHFVDRCMASLFQNRGPLWARPKIDAFFQDVFYRRSVFTPEQQTQLEAWQSRIKTSQRMGERQVGEANNPLEAQRPVVDSREFRTVLDSDSNAWAAKQTFDSRESSAGRVIR